MSLLAIHAALEALEAGDTRQAEAVLLGALEDQPARPQLHACACGASFPWPGLLQAHQDIHGHEGRRVA